MAERVGVMVGGRVLTKQYVLDEIGRVDLADLIARGAERISPEDLDANADGGGLGGRAGDPDGRVRADGASALDARRAADRANARGRAADRRQNGWDRRVVQGLVNVLADAMERPEFRSTVGEVRSRT